MKTLLFILMIFFTQFQLSNNKIEPCREFRDLLIDEKYKCYGQPCEKCLKQSL